MTKRRLAIVADGGGARSTISIHRVFTEEQYCCEEGWSEALWKDVENQKEEKKKTIN